MALDDRLSALTPEQRALFEKLRERKKQENAPPRTPQPPPIARRGPGVVPPLSFDQERLWFLYKLNPEDPLYNIDTASRIRGPLDLAALESAFQEIPRRHEIWRTVFPEVEGRPVQEVLPEMRLPSGIIDLRALPRAIREATAYELMRVHTNVPACLETGPMAKALLLRIEDEDCICQLVVHHVITDWVTFQLFWYEIGVLYAAFHAGRPSPLPPPLVQYADYTVWQREWMRGEVEGFFLRYWVEQLRDAPLTLTLPFDRPRPALMTSRGDRVPVRVERAAEVKSAARREGLTPFMTVLAAYQLVLWRWSGQDRVIVGSPNANRNRLEIQEIFGFFLTQLPFCTDFAGDPTLREALLRTREVALAAYKHQDIPFGRIVEALHPERDLSHLPVVQVVLLLLDGSVLSPKLADLALEPVDVHDGTARYDVMFAMWDHPERIHGWYEYNADLWDKSTAARLVESFDQVLAALLADPGRRLSEIPWVSEATAHQVLLEWNDTASAQDAPPVPRAIAERAAATPERVAVVGEDGEVLTYADLERRAASIAAALRARGVRRGDRVAVKLERTPDLVAALLGVWKAGAAYVPLDPAHPEERLALVLEDARVVAVLGEEEVKDIKDFKDNKDDQTSFPLPEEPAYLLFTSGSTGRPKGVEVSHGSLAQLLQALAGRYGIGPGDAFLAVTTVSFDIAGLELFLPLVTGGRLLLAGRETAGDGALLARALEERGATVLQGTPATWRQILDAGWPGLPGLLRLCGGEALPRDLADRLLDLPGRELWNQYGPTETTIWSTVQRVEREPVTVGRPIANTTVHVLGKDLAPVPPGGAGELFLGGAGVARGYFGRPDRTAERFLPDPFAGTPGARFYRTGDLARHLADGRLEIRGRTDHQVKLRGFRIEPGEIEAALRRQPGVADAAAVLQQTAEDSRLLAAIVPAPSSGAAAPDPAALRDALGAILPAYMIPTAFVTLAALPLGPSGKVDRNALARLAPRSAAAAGPAPQGEDQERLAALWAQVLEVEAGAVGAASDFFALGGHSLLATRLISRIRDAFGVELPVRAVFQAPVLAAQARRIAAERAAGPPVAGGPIPALPRAEGRLTAPLSFAQERLWFLDRLLPGNPAYNLAVALRLDGPLAAAALAAAFQRLAERHEALRTAFREREGRPVQEVVESVPLLLQTTDLSAADDPEAEARRLAGADALRPFDLATAPLLRATLLALGPDRHVLLLAMHHIVSDAWSMGILVDDLTAFMAGRSLPPLLVQPADVAVWQRERLTGAELDRQLAYWRGALGRAPAVLDLPTDRPRPAVQSLRGGTVPFALDAATGAALAGLARQGGATLFMVLLAGWGALLGRLADQDDLVAGTAVANRDRPEVERLIGFFVNTLALRVDLTGAPSFAELTGRLRQGVLDAFSHRDLPFEKLVEELHPARDRGRQPLFQALLTFQNVPRGGEGPAGLALAPLPVEGQTTKFDLTLTVFEEAGRIEGQLEYAADLFDRATALRWSAALGRLLAGAAAAPATRVAELPLLSAEERHEVLVRPNETASSYPRDASLGALFLEQAALHGTDVAVVADGAEVTWAELERRSSNVARRLVARGLAPETRVALAAERSPDLIAGLLGIVRAGYAYLPLDPADPPERLAWMLGDAGATLLLADRGLPGTLPDGLALLSLGEAVGEGAPDRPLPRVPAESLAYVMYTSGSTGTPKGVAVTHRNVVRLVRGADYADLGPGEVWLQNAPVSFDAATLEIWAPLLSGGRLALMPPGRAGLDDLASAIARFGVTSLWLTAGLFHQMAEHRLDGLRPLRQLLAGGDAVAPEAARRVRQGLPDLALIDGYGPTEGTTFTCCHRVTGAETGGALPIGRPIGNARVYVLSEAFEPAPPGTPGELCAGGDGLARGYLGRPALTAERFVPDPFSGLPGERLYRTGDRVRWNREAANPALEFLGRLDGQVKIRGVRAEPGEVEAALAAHPAVRQAAVLARESPGGKLLAAYVVASGETPAAELQRFLRERLPEALVPAAWAFPGSLPLTPNGKVDRRALAALEVEAARAEVEYVAPRTPLEETLAAAVAGVLGLDPRRVGIHDSFFGLGGHSLLATRLVAELRERHGIEVPLPLLFDSTDLADLADQLDARELAAADESVLEELLAELDGGGE